MCPRAGRVISGAVTVLVLLSLQSLCAAQAPTTTSAREDPGPEDVQEVVVTATRREERLQDVPISVSAFSQEKLDQQGLRSIDDPRRLTPGVTFQRNGTGSAANYNDESSDISIRGIDSEAGTSTTGIYIDDTPVQSRHISFGSVNAFPELFDVDRVEVLRGPQGTLFGAGAEGGAVRFISPQASLTQDSGYIRSELTTTRNGDPSYELGAAGGGPIIDDVLGFRVSASYRRDGGWVDRVNYSLTPNPPDSLLPTPEFNRITQSDANWQETVTLRGALKWAVSDTLSVSPSLYYQQLHINDTASYWVGLSNPSADTLLQRQCARESQHRPVLAHRRQDRLEPRLRPVDLQHLAIRPPSAFDLGLHPVSTGDLSRPDLSTARGRRLCRLR